MMSWAIVAIVAIIVWGMVQFHKTRSGILSDEAGNERRELAHDDAALKAELEELRERVKVLEKIATDPALRTAREIEKLRDERTE